ncbi:ATP synthase subunit s, mitochondrial-like [Nematostella vectensis]|uniref:ATP synthase subunit s, mitochondrial-like n=2 Tax=Nematostella vectensis TaxID=45351 RepID=UPI00207742E3|nr:ATP synthase subunit s, mitochondrial-like [Nematostella vectensis]
MEICSLQAAEHIKKIHLSIIGCRVAAEWILRCGGGVKFHSHDSWMRNYNALAPGPGHKYRLQGIDAQDTCVTTGGLLHLEGLHHLEYLSLHNCKYITDLNHLQHVKNSLRELDIGNCHGISDIQPLEQMTKLQKLNLSGASRIKDKDKSISDLLKKLPECEVKM